MNRKEAIQKDVDFHVDFDQESKYWGIFGTESGFCYELHSTEESANYVAKKFRNQLRRKKRK